MNLRELAEQDLAFTLEDNVGGFGWPLTIKDPAGNYTTDLYGQSDDIAQIIDPDTGEIVSGRRASVVVRISSLTAQGFGFPESVPEINRKPWLVTFDDINGNEHTFKIIQSHPDRALGVISMLLEGYKKA